MDVLRETLLQLSEYLCETKQRMIEEEEQETEHSDWRFMAMVGGFIVCNISILHHFRRSIALVCLCMPSYQLSSQSVCMFRLRKIRSLFLLLNESIRCSDEFVRQKSFLYIEEIQAEARVYISRAKGYHPV